MISDCRRKDISGFGLSMTLKKRVRGIKKSKVEVWAEKIQTAGERGGRSFKEGKDCGRGLEKKLTTRLFQASRQIIILMRGESVGRKGRTRRNSEA